MTRDESRAIAFLGVLLCLALVARYMNRPKPVTINAGAVDIEALRAAGRALAQNPQPRARPRKRSERAEAADTAAKQPWTKPAWQRAGSAPSFADDRSAAPPPKAAGPLNLNRATEAEIEGLPWIGPAMAKRIIARRDSVKRFDKLEDLDAVKGIGPALLKKIEPLVTF